MYFSKLQPISQPSFLILNQQLEQQTRRKRIQQRNSIKVNRRKLPSDFFKNIKDKSVNKRILLDSYTTRLSIPKTTPFIKQLLTQRKIASYRDLMADQFDNPCEFTLAKTQVLRCQEDKKHGFRRKLFLNEIESTNNKLKDLDVQKTFNYVNIKLIKDKQSVISLQTKRDSKNLIGQKLGTNANISQSKQLKKNMINKTEMGCTFGKGFRKQQNQSHEHSIVIKDSNISQELNYQNDNKHYKYNITGFQDKKQRLQKSTQQSQGTEGFKSNQNSPVRLQSSRKILLMAQQTPYFQHPKSNRINWSIYNHDQCLLKDLSRQKSKQVFTAEEKQRKTKYRINNSSNDCREKPIRKQKKINQINLPKITKTSNLLLSRQI